MVKQTVGTMSGGEKARLVLAMMVWQRPNLLLLDEPTNHLDLATREALSMALNEFEGTVMLVSHDRALLRAVCDEFWLVGRGKVVALRRRPGRLPALPAGRIQAPARTGAAGKRRGRAAPWRRPHRQRRRPSSASRMPSSASNCTARVKPLKRELEQAEKRMAELNAEKAGLEARMAASLPPAEIAEAGKRLKAVNDELHQLEERWLLLSGDIEAD